MLKSGLLLLTAGILLLATSYALRPQAFFKVHDFTHAARIGEMLIGLREGQLPVRWSANFGFGYGMPLYLFYAPLPFLVAAVFFGLGLDIVNTMNLMLLISNIITMSGAYFLGKRLLGSAAGVLLATLYSLATYRALNIFVRGAWSEVWAMAFLPWILLGIVLMIHRHSNGFWLALGGYVGLFLSHNLTSLMFVPASGVFAAIYWAGTHWQQRRQWLSGLLSWGSPLVGLWQTASSLLLAIGLSAFYLFPALTENSLTKISQIFSGYFDFRLHFLYLRQFVTPFWGFGGSNWGPEDEMSFFLGFGILLSLAVAVATITYRLFRRRLMPRVFALMITSALLLGVSIWLSLSHAQPFWEAVPVLAIIQFPWRWLSLVAIFGALFATVGVSLIQPKRLRLSVVIVLVIFSIATNTPYFRPEGYLDNANSLYYTDPPRIQSEMSQILPDYIPRQMADRLTPPTQAFLVPAGTESKVELIIDRAHQKLYKTEFTSPVVLNPQVADFPGWQFSINGRPQPTVAGEQGTLAVEVPAGRQLVSLNFERTPVRQVSDSISAFSLLVVLGIGTYGHIRRGR